MAVGADDIGIGKGADDVANGLTFADVGEEFVAEALALTGASDQAGDIDEFDGGGDDFLGVVELGEVVQTGVRDGDDANVWLDGGKRIIGGEGASIG